MRAVIELTCRAGHTQLIQTAGPDDQVQDFADLLSGRSALFVHPIPDDQVDGAPGSVGFCMCGARIQPPVVTELPEQPS